MKKLLENTAASSSGFSAITKKHWASRNPAPGISFFGDSSVQATRKPLYIFWSWKKTDVPGGFCITFASATGAHFFRVAAGFAQLPHKRFGDVFAGYVFSGKTGWKHPQRPGNELADELVIYLNRMKLREP
jgi:hypothetical protein